MFDISRQALGRTLGVLALIGCALSAFADQGSFTATGNDTLTGSQVTFTGPNTSSSFSFTDKKTSTGHPLTFSAYVSSTNGPETAVKLNTTLVAGGSYTLVLPNGASPTLQIGGAAPGTTIFTGTSISSPPTQDFTAGVTVTVPATAAPGTYTGSITYNMTIDTSGGGGCAPAITLTYTYTVVAPTLSNLTVSPNPVIGTIGSTGTVTLATVAPTGGQLVSLGSNSSNVIVPANMTVLAGSTTGTFAITTLQPAVTFTGTITASTASPASSKQATLLVYANYVTNLVFNRSSVLGGTVVTATVDLYQPAGSAGQVINLSTQYPSTVTVPASITISAGQSNTTFSINTTPSTVSTTCGVYAETADGNTAHNATLTIQGDSIASLGLSPSAIVGGGTSTGTVTLTSPAPALGWTVNLISEYPSSVQVPSSVTFAAGASTATFNITSTQLSSATLTCGIYSSDGVSKNALQNANLTVLGDSISSLSIAPSTIVGGVTATGTITLTANAPTGGWTVNLKSQYPSLVGVPSSVTVLAATNSITFNVTTTATLAQYTSNVSASDGLSGANTTVTITPVPVPH